MISRPHQRLKTLSGQLVSTTTIANATSTKTFGKPLIFVVIDKTNGMMGIYRPTEEFVKGGEFKVEKAIEVYNKFYSIDAELDIETFYYDEFL